MSANLSAEGDLSEALDNGMRLLERDPSAAVEQADAIIERNPDGAKAYRLRAAALRLLGRNHEADEAEQEALKASARHPLLFDARIRLAHNRIAEAERQLRTYLQDRPHEPVGLRMLAEVAMRAGHPQQAEALLRQALQIAPHFAAAQADLDALLMGKTGVVPGPDREREEGGRDASTEYGEAIALCEDMLARTADRASLWLHYGLLLRAAGRRQDSIAALRRATALLPELGEAWWSLADLKTVQFGEDDIRIMSAALATPDLSEENRVALHYALGKGLEDHGRYEESFRHYEQGGHLRRQSRPHEPEALERFVRDAEALFTPAFFEQRRGMGSAAPGPIFILGMPRAGSTLIEQILSSHSQIEGTMELNDLPDIAKVVGKGHVIGHQDSHYFDSLAAMTPQEAADYGAAYLWGAGLKRHTRKPFFVDKMPINWLQVGLIQLILPNAKIIDARRHPLSCCFSNFKQNFTAGQAFSFDLDDLGRFYRSYARMLAHFDAIAPGRIHRVLYEALVEDPESEIRRLLDFLGLPFEESCLHFHQNARAVRTSSSEQVRRPINREGLEQWRHFEPWLGPLKDALGPIVESYPAAPERWD